MKERVASRTAWARRGGSVSSWLLLLASLTLGNARAAADSEPPDNAKADAEASDAAADEEERELDELLGPQHEELMVVSASRREESLLEAPVSVTVVGEEQIAASTADDMGELLRGVPGLNVVQISARDIHIVSRAPGTSLATSQLALVDGRSIYQDFFGFVMWDLLPVSFSEIKQVEVVRGPGSAVWGANALTGVINVITKTPRDLEGSEIRVEAGEVGTRSLGLRHAQAGKKFSFRISAAYYEQDPWSRENHFADGTPIPDTFEFENEGTAQPKLDMRVDYEPQEGRRWTWQAGHSGSSGLMYSGIGPFRLADDSRSTYVLAGYQRDNFDAKFHVTRLDGQATNLLNGLVFDFLTDTWVAEATGNRVVGDHHYLVYGASARVNDFELSLAPGEDSGQSLGVFLEDRLTINNRWSTNLGLRMDWFDTIGLGVTPRLNVIYKPRPNQSIRLAYSRAFRSPSLVNLYLNTAVLNTTVLPNGRDFNFVTQAQGNAELEQETIDAAELAYTAFLPKNNTFTAALYRNRTKDVIDFFPKQYYSEEDPPIGLPADQVPERELVKVFAYRNIGAVVDEGLELSLDTTWRPGVWTTATYSYQRPSRVVEDDVIEPLNSNAAPKHQASLGLTVKARKWGGSCSVSYTGDAFWTDVLDYRFWGTTDSFVLVNASLIRRFPKDRGQIKLSASDALDKEFKQHSFGDTIRRKLSAEVVFRF